jgi:hypothetical protein
MLSDLSVPLQGMYCASRHAVRGFIDALRMEGRHAGEPASFTLIKPASVNGMLALHARHCMAMKPDLPPPVYAARVAADAILHAAEHPVREIFAGEAAMAGSSPAHPASGIADMAPRNLAVGLPKGNEKDLREHGGNLFASVGDGTLQESEPRTGPTFRHSPYTEAVTHWTGPLGLPRKLAGT